MIMKQLSLINFSVFYQNTQRSIYKLDISELRINLKLFNALINKYSAFVL
jgi:hypothetical protein